MKLSEVRFSGFAVGYGKADITPDPTTKISLTGNNDDRTRLSTGRRESLWANCIAFTDTDGTTVILFGTDLHGTEDDVWQEIQQGIEERTGVPAYFMQAGASHNHQAPNQCTFSLTPVRMNNKVMVQKCIQAAVDAMEDRAVAKMYMGIGRPEDMVFTRHFVLKNGDYLGWGGPANSRFDEIQGYMEKGDNLLQVVKFVREGKKDVAVINWQGHPHGRIGTDRKDSYTLLYGGGPTVMRDKLLEKADCESVYIMGGSGNSTQAPFLRPHNKFADYEHYGETLADEVIKVFENMTPAQTGKIHYYADMRVFPVPGDVRKRPYAAFGFGDFGYAAQPFESFQSNAIAVREASPYFMTIYNQVANGNRVSGYLPDAKSWTYDCYEHRPCFSPPGSGEVVQQWLTDMIWDLFRKSGQSVKEKLPGYYRDRTPKWDGNTYDILPDQEITPSKYGHCPIQAILNGQEVNILAETEELARKILERKQVKLLINEQNMTVGLIDN